MSGESPPTSASRLASSSAISFAAASTGGGEGDWLTAASIAANSAAGRMGFGKYPSMPAPRQRRAHRGRALAMDVASEDLAHRGALALIDRLHQASKLPVCRARLKSLSSLAP